MVRIYVIYLVFLVFLMSSLVLITRWSAKRRKEKRFLKMPDQRMNMAPEEYKAKRKQVFSQYPELNRFVTIKHNLFIVLAIYLVVIRLMALIIISGQDQKPLYFVLFLAGCLFQIGVLGLVMGSSWKAATVVYLWVFYNIGILANGLYQNGITFFDYLSSYAVRFEYMPMEIVVGSLELVYVLLMLLLAMWLTLVPKNRRLADQQTLLAQSIHTGGPLP